MSLAVKSLGELSKIKHYYGFRYLLNAAVHEQIFDKLKLATVYPEPNKLKILDLYPGPSQHSAILYNRCKPAQHVLMDARPDFVKHISQFITENSQHAQGFQLVTLDPYDWHSYTELIDRNKVMVPSHKGREAIHNEFLVVANLTGMIGEGLFMQWLACIGNCNWLQRFGRVKILVWVPESTALKLLAKPGDHLRSKCSVVTEAFTETKLVAVMKNKTETSFNSSLLEKHRPVMFESKDVWMPSGKPISLLEIDPRDHKVDLDNFDYVTKHLLILKSTPLYDALESLGHGGKEYFCSVIGDDRLLQKCPKDLTVSEFIYCTEIFDKWPFKPDIYLDFIDVFQDND
ncbi:LANO_0H17568g1_1 [Lachancea nothofagi CBS 11611]|uniref:rRNA adenine N(6)-methyltransferase n=1 Tax=Lachancea nothofagi CBS 11611 TaxID=1266666 RepID=A0A1G4KN05_9SACH|nr:LANO_0H17568g1_1 [Lachancea nothofagi CBS 11611]